MISTYAGNVLTNRKNLETLAPAEPVPVPEQNAAGGSENRHRELVQLSDGVLNKLVQVSTVHITPSSLQSLASLELKSRQSASQPVRAEWTALVESGQTSSPQHLYGALKKASVALQQFIANSATLESDTPTIHSLASRELYDRRITPELRAEWRTLIEVDGTFKADGLYERLRTATPQLLQMIMENPTLGKDTTLIKRLAQRIHHDRGYLPQKLRDEWHGLMDSAREFSCADLPDRLAHSSDALLSCIDGNPTLKSDLSDIQVFAREVGKWGDVIRNLKRSCHLAADTLGALRESARRCRQGPDEGRWETGGSSGPNCQTKDVRLKTFVRTKRERANLQRKQIQACT